MSLKFRMMLLIISIFALTSCRDYNVTKQIIDRRIYIQCINNNGNKSYLRITDEVHNVFYEDSVYNNTNQIIDGNSVDIFEYDNNMYEKYIPSGWQSGLYDYRVKVLPRYIEYFAEDKDGNLASLFMTIDRYTGNVYSVSHNIIDETSQAVGVCERSQDQVDKNIIF